VDSAIETWTLPSRRGSIDAVATRHRAGGAVSAIATDMGRPDLKVVPDKVTQGRTVYEAEVVRTETTLRRPPQEKPLGAMRPGVFG
jgi:hypothetical protein